MSRKVAIAMEGRVVNVERCIYSERRYPSRGTPVSVDDELPAKVTRYFAMVGRRLGDRVDGQRRTVWWQSRRVPTIDQARELLSWPS